MSAAPTLEYVIVVPQAAPPRRLWTVIEPREPEVRKHVEGGCVAGRGHGYELRRVEGATWLSCVDCGHVLLPNWSEL